MSRPSVFGRGDQPHPSISAHRRRDRPRSRCGGGVHRRMQRGFVIGAEAPASMAAGRWNHAARRDRRLRDRVLGRARWPAWSTRYLLRWRPGLDRAARSACRWSTSCCSSSPRSTCAAGRRPNFTHGLAAAYLGFSVAFGHSMVRWADQRFAHRFAGGPPPWRPPKQGAGPGALRVAGVGQDAARLGGRQCAAGGGDRGRRRCPAVRRSWPAGSPGWAWSPGSGSWSVPCGRPCSASPCSEHARAPCNRLTRYRGTLLTRSATRAWRAPPR